MKKLKLSIVPTIALAVFGMFSGCMDSGSAPTAPVPSQNSPTIIDVNPRSASVGDTLTITGSHFGATQGSSRVVVGGISIQSVLLWSDTRIVVTVPVGALTGSVAVIVDGVSSNVVSITISGTPPVQVSFRSDVLPIFTAHGCLSCHGGSGGLVCGFGSAIASGRARWTGNRGRQCRLEHRDRETFIYSAFWSSNADGRAVSRQRDNSDNFRLDK